MATKIKNSLKFQHVSVPTFYPMANLMIKRSNEDEFENMTYLEAMEIFGHFIESEEAFITRIFRQIGGSHSNLKKSAIFLLPVAGH